MSTHVLIQYISYYRKRGTSEAGNAVLMHSKLMYNFLYDTQQNPFIVCIRTHSQLLLNRTKFSQHSEGQESALVRDVLIIDVFCHHAREGMATPQMLHERGLELLRKALNHCRQTYI